MNNYIIQSICYGLSTIIICEILINIIFNNREQELKKYIILYNKLDKYYIKYIIFFLMGVIFFLILEYINLNKWYCNKLCANNKCVKVCFTSF